MKAEFQTLPIFTPLQLLTQRSAPGVASQSTWMVYSSMSECQKSGLLGTEDVVLISELDFRHIEKNRM